MKHPLCRSILGILPCLGAFVAATPAHAIFNGQLQVGDTINVDCSYLPGAGPVAEASARFTVREVTPFVAATRTAATMSLTGSYAQIKLSEAKLDGAKTKYKERFEYHESSGLFSSTPPLVGGAAGLWQVQEGRPIPVGISADSVVDSRDKKGDVKSITSIDLDNLADNSRSSITYKGVEYRTACTWSTRDTSCERVESNVGGASGATIIRMCDVSGNRMSSLSWSAAPDAPAATIHGSLFPEESAAVNAAVAGFKGFSAEQLSLVRAQVAAELQQSRDAATPAERQRHAWNANDLLKKILLGQSVAGGAEPSQAMDATFATLPAALACAPGKVAFTTCVVTHDISFEGVVRPISPGQWFRFCAKVDAQGNATPISAVSLVNVRERSGGKFDRAIAPYEKAEESILHFTDNHGGGQSSWNQWTLKNAAAGQPFDKQVQPFTLARSESVTVGVSVRPGWTGLTCQTGAGSL